MSLGNALKELSTAERVCTKTPLDLLTVYVELTNSCPFFCTHCPAGSHTRRPKPRLLPIPNMLRELENLASRVLATSMFVDKIVLTGGEPLILENLYFGIDQIRSAFLRDTAPTIYLHTSGVNLDRWAAEPSSKEVTTVISRYHHLDSCNQEIFRVLPYLVPPATAGDVWSLAQSHPVELSCTLVKNGIETVEDMHEYMEAAAVLGVQRVSFLAPYNFKRPLDLFRPTESPSTELFGRKTKAGRCSCEDLLFSSAEGKVIPFSVTMGKPCDNNLYLRTYYGEKGTAWTTSFWEEPWGLDHRRPRDAWTTSFWEE